ncbi:MAG: CoA transferase [Lachnospiraceae bacterium]|jgi:crotonobetainyl-CoA:carnitine CoA-transferase CaiB-like acyl-CoA transferase|nr:CoA transferase [Lachnospiraceae bacterium]
MKPLEGITVVELATHFAAPACGRVLSEQGARVIKVENPKGEPCRKFGPVLGNPCKPDENPIFEVFNGGKEDIVLNMREPQDQEKLRFLLEKVDVFITNNRPGVLKSMGVDYDSIKDRCPQLIYGLLSAYGEKGDKANDSGFDSIAFWANSGFLQDMSVPVEGGYPVYIPMGIADSCCGTILAGAIGTALYNKTKTGRGDCVCVSLYGTAVWAMAMMSTGTQYGYQWPRDRYQGSPMGVPLKTKDGKWMLCVVENYDRDWAKFCKAWNCEDLIDNPRFNSRQATLDPQNRKDAVLEMEKRALLCDSKEVDKALTEANVVHTILSHIKDLHSSKQALDNHFLYEHTYPSGKKVTLANPCVQFRSFGHNDFEAAPELGADTERVLKEFGIL